MYRQTRPLALVLALMLAATTGFAGGGREEAPAAEPPAAERLEELGTAGETPEEWSVKRASNLIGTTAVTMDYEEVGTVSDIVVELASGYTRYLVFSFEDVQGYGGRTYPIPQRFLRYDPEREAFVIPAEDRDVIQNAPTLAQKRPGVVSTWSVNYPNYWNTYAATYLRPEEVTRISRRPYYWYSGTRMFPGVVTFYSRIAEMDVLGPAGSVVARVEDMIVDLDSGQALRLVLQSEAAGTPGLTPVPISAFVLDSRREARVLKGSQRELERAPDFAPGEWPDIHTASWRRTVSRYWENEQPELALRDGMQVVPGQTLELDEIEGMDLLNPQGQTLGSIEDIVVTRTKRVPYAAVEFGGTLGIGGEWYYVPMGAFSIDLIRRAAITNIDRRMLEEMPGFEPGTLPDTRRPDWDLEIQAYWQESSRPGSEMLAARINRMIMDEQERRREEPGAILASDLIGYRVENTLGNQLGDVRGLIVDLHHTRLAYVSISVSRVPSMAGQLIPVPPEAITIDTDERLIVLDADREFFAEAPSYAPRAWTGSPVMPEQVDEYWDYWPTNVPLRERQESAEEE